MRYFFNTATFILLGISIISAQEISREGKLQKIGELHNQIKNLEADILAPDAKDLKKAEKSGLEVFRLMPRERYARKLFVQGGGAYYSFTNKSHDYQKIPQIELEQNNLSVGFAGADYGFIADLGETPLEFVTKETPEANFLLGYQPPPTEPEIRIEQRKANNYEVGGFTYKDRLTAVVGHSYVLRAITFGNADVLTAFKIYRQDTDGSLIIFWKMLEHFEKPLIARN